MARPKVWCRPISMFEQERQLARFSGKVAVVTGGASGIGAAIAARLAGEGANVLVADRNPPAALPGGARFHQCDVTNTDQVGQALAEAASAWGRLDILVNNAGVGALAMAEDTDEALWDHVFAVNTRAVFLCCRAAIPLMRANPGGSGGAIVNIASISGLLGDYGMSAYNASKGAVVNLTRSLALETAQYGIRVNAVCPGLIDTPMSAPGLQRQEDLDFWLERIPLGRRGLPEEMASVVAFLASDDASYVTGANLPADGGVMAHTGQPNFPARRALRQQKV